MVTTTHREGELVCREATDLDAGYAIVKGIIQGLTEFLPVSSSAHLVFIRTLAGWMGMDLATTSPYEEEFFDILLHVGTLVSLLIYFRQDISRMALSCIQCGIPKLERTLPESESLPPGTAWTYRSLPLLIIISTAVTVAMVLFMDKVSEVIISALGLTSETVTNAAEFYHQHPIFVAIHLLFTGLLLFGVEKYSQRQLQTRTDNPESRTQQLMGWKQAAAIGFFQSIAATFRGVSRSGSTIAGGMICGLDRLTSARYSFLLSMMTFIAAAVYESLKMMKLGMIEAVDWPPMLLGTGIAAITGYFCVKYFIQFVARQSLIVFSVYCWTVGVLMIVGLTLWPVSH